MGTRRAYNHSLSELSKIIHNGREFKLLLPGKKKTFRPSYNCTFFVRGDYVVFEAAVTHEEVFVGQVITSQPGNEYDVQFIKRPEGHDRHNRVNWMAPRLRVQRKHILCELIPEN